jgi:hypothetical protein
LSALVPDTRVETTKPTSRRQHLDQLATGERCWPSPGGTRVFLEAFAVVRASDALGID